MNQLKKNISIQSNKFGLKIMGWMVIVVGSMLFQQFSLAFERKYWTRSVSASTRYCMYFLWQSCRSASL